MRSLVGSGTSSYSGCGCVTHGGDRAFSISRAHTGGMLGSAAPAAISTIAIANCITPTASAMQWHTWMPKIIPPHESRTKGRSTTSLEVLSGSQSSWSLHGIGGLSAGPKSSSRTSALASTKTAPSPVHSTISLSPGPARSRPARG
ncbi:hypothetical protein ACMD2_19239 [Ananas comosus]|uniref:Uncharacterized protein n=1 Tax=Ananas comosus TaxID=4615 RepID=A0A199V1U5_ANACO|nr:hypothetical protein ACMD2_19239 [Ananas comosus]